MVALVLLQFTEMRILWHHQAMTWLRAGFQTRSTNNDWHHSLLRPPSLETEAPKLRIVYLQRFCFVLPVLGFPHSGKLPRPPFMQMRRRSEKNFDANFSSEKSRSFHGLVDSTQPHRGHFQADHLSLSRVGTSPGSGLKTRDEIWARIIEA